MRILLRKFIIILVLFSKEIYCRSWINLTIIPPLIDSLYFLEGNATNVLFMDRSPSSVPTVFPSIQPSQIPTSTPSIAPSARFQNRNSNGNCPENTTLHRIEMRDSWGDGWTSTSLGMREIGSDSGTYLFKGTASLV